MKNTKRFLLIVSLVLVFAAMFALAAAAAEVKTGKVNVTDADNDLTWEFDTETKVLTIKGTSTTLSMDPSASWETDKQKNIPWFDYKGEVTKLVIEAPVTCITATFGLGQMGKLTTVVLPDTDIEIGAGNTVYNVFASSPNLVTFGPAGTPEGIIDIRRMTGKGSQIFENCFAGKTVTVLMPEEGEPCFPVSKFGTDASIVTIKVAAGSPGETLAKGLVEKATATEKNMIADNITIVYYDGSEADTTKPADTTTSADTTKPADSTASGDTTASAGTEELPGKNDLQDTRLGEAVYGTPVLDGEIDDVWATAKSFDFPWDRNGSNFDNLAIPMVWAEGEAPYAKVLWDAENLYVLYYVKDANLHADAAITSYNRDSVEIYIDELNEKKTTVAESKSYHQVWVSADGAEGTANNDGVANWSAKTYDDHYVIEVAYKFKAIKPKTNTVIGFDLSINGNATGTNKRDNCWSWNDKTNMTWQNPFYMGNLKLIGGEGVNEEVKPGATGDPIAPGTGDVICEGKDEGQYHSVNWKLTSDGTLTISANEGWTNWNEVPQNGGNSTTTRWYMHNDKIKRVVIGAGLSKIGANSFVNCPNLEIVEMATISQMSNNVFVDCPKLTTIYIKGNAPVIGTADFSGVVSYDGGENVIKNSGITALKLSEKLTTLAAKKFVDNAYLTNVTFGEKIETVNDDSFAGCYNLKVVFGTKGTAAETFATAKSMTFAEVGSVVEIPEAVVTTAEPETTATPATSAPDTSAPVTSDDATTDTTASGGETTKEPDGAAQTGDINLAMVVAFAVAALGAAVVLTRKKRFN